MYSTHAHRADVGRTSARPRSPLRSRSSFLSIDGMASYGVPSIGVFRFATNGATPYASDTIFETSVPNRISSSMSSFVSPGSPTIM